MPHYAWSPIRAGTNEKPLNIKRGEEVTRADLNIDDADWQAMLDTGSVRPKKFPAPEEFTGSAVGFVRQQLQEATSMSSVDEEEAVSELAQISEGASHQERTPRRRSESGKK